MALVSSSDPNLRIYEPSFSTEYSSRKEEAAHRSHLLAKIHNAYCKALERLTTNSKHRRAEIEDLERRSLDGMVTFLTRFFSYLADCEAVRYLLLADADLLVATRIVVMDRRMKRFGSSELAVEEALRMALKCAALVSRHPHPDRLVGAWITISTHLDEVVSLLANVQRRSPSSSSSLDQLTALLAGPEPSVDDRRGDLLRSWKLATCRPPRPRNLPYQNTSTGLKRVLLDAVHGFYLQALARLPAGELHSRYQRSMLMAGHCYGPLDPVSNILLNTIWYDAACPPTVKLELGDMISTLVLHRIETRSMYGLVSFLCTRYHHLNFHQACRCLLDADANLLLADPNFDPEAAVAATAALRSEKRIRRLRSPWGTAIGFHKTLLTGRVDTEAKGPASTVIKAFTAAATAGWHPNPDDQANFLASCKQTLGSSDMVLLQGDGQLSSEDVKRLSRLLSPESACEKPLVLLPLQDLPLDIKEYVRTHARVSTKVKAALYAYALTPNGEPIYELHSICGFNNQVSGPVYCPEIDTYPPEKFCDTHVNFLATPKGSTHSHNNGTLILFFAEISNDDEDKARLCCPVSVPPPCAERVRCLYCDYSGIRIVHPSGENFNGREEEFENMVCKKDPYDEDFDPSLMPQYYTNENIISESSDIAEEVGKLEEDCMYSESYGCDEHSESDDYDTDMDYATDEYELI
ncbi:hypothetical protein PR202_gb00436 [Eleusine coracana subsp. coracana]|uniref:Uncharacterized protein n=1 Tax=Eleusine coracana subsp. coracana TaxID=191504 RepID=A0AAV5DU58_ELECO|nr:hypothetical protein PR202_gb00436 [Eleusine coracana subsp. coracana]